MRIETYFDSLKNIIDNCSVIQSSNVNYDKRATYEGFLRGELYFIDDSILFARKSQKTNLKFQINPKNQI